MHPGDLQQGDLIYYEDESGKKDNLCVVIETLKDGCTVANANGEEFKVESAKLFSIPLDEEVLDKISEFEKLDRFYYKGEAEYGGDYFIYEYDWDDGGNHWVNVYLHHNDINTMTVNKHKKHLANCIMVGSFYYVHDLQHLENLLSAYVGMFTIGDKIHGIDHKIKIGEPGYHGYLYICDGVGSLTDYEKWKKDQEWKKDQ